MVIQTSGHLSNIHFAFNENLHCPFLNQFSFCDLTKYVLFSLCKMFSSKQDKDFEQDREV